VIERRRSIGKGRLTTGKSYEEFKELKKSIKLDQLKVEKKSVFRRLQQGLTGALNRTLNNSNLEVANQ
jgi:hypothetical protein